MSLRNDSQLAGGGIDLLSQRRLLALEATKLAWWNFDPRTNRLQFGEGCAAIFGGSVNTDAEDDLIRRCIQPEDWPKVSAALEAACDPANEKPVITSYRIARPDGETRWMKSHALATFDGCGAERFATSVVVTMEDITSVKQEHEMAAQATGLRAVGLLVGGISHDFSNLLTIIYANLQFAELHLEGGKALEFIQLALDATERGALFNRRLQSLSERLPSKRHARVISSDIEETAGVLRRVLGETIHLRVELTGDLWPVVIIRSEVESALLNLALNARDAMAAGGEIVIVAENVTVSADEGGGSTVRPGEYVKLQVRDNGSGMSADILRRAGEPFFTTKGAGKGAGLGLTAVSRIAEAEGGAMLIESKEGQGTQVSLFLPRCSSDRSVGSAAAGSP